MSDGVAGTILDGRTRGNRWLWTIGAVVATLLLVGIISYLSGWRPFSPTSAAEIEQAKKELDDKKKAEEAEKLGNVYGAPDPFLAALAGGGPPAAPPPGVKAAPATAAAVSSAVKIDPGASVTIYTEDHDMLSALYVQNTLDAKQCVAAYKATMGLLPADKRPTEEVMNKFEALFLSSGHTELAKECAEEVKKKFSVEELKVMLATAMRYPWLNEKLGMPRIYDNKRSAIGVKYLQKAQAAPKASP